MDAWIVVAAAGAGYIAQQLKTLSRKKQNLSASSSKPTNFLKHESSLLMRREQQSKNVFADGELVYQDGHVEDEVVSTSGLDIEEPLILSNNADCDILSLSTLSTWSFSNGILPGSHGVSKLNVNTCANSGGVSFADCNHPSPKKRNILMSRQTNPLFDKSLSSLESCLMAHLYNKHAERKENFYNSIPSPSAPPARPLLVTDGNATISRANNDSFKQKETYVLHNERDSAKNVAILGVPSLADDRIMEYSRTEKHKREEKHAERLSISRKMVDGKCLNSQGSSQGALLFFLGMSVGIISSLLTNKQEVSKLNELLKRTESLVLDLQEELEMKDSLTVKELAIEEYESQEMCETCCNDRAHEVFSSSGHHEVFHGKSSEEKAFSKIEAELEAELERLELNMNSSNLGVNLSDIVELDPGYAPDIVRGELRADMLEREAGDQTCTDRERSGSSTTHSANYAVSPRELCLRLHEVLQLRLEERVKELEDVLQNSQRKVEYTELHQKVSNAELPEVEDRHDLHISACGSPIAIEEKYPEDQPVVINLSGESVDAYEAYEEFNRMNSTEENLSPEFMKDSIQDSLKASDPNSYWIQSNAVNHYASHPIISDENASEDYIYQKENDYNINWSRDGSDDDHDEMERLLIQHILEKTRNGSPAVLNAQRLLFSMDESEH